MKHARCVLLSSLTLASLLIASCGGTSHPPSKDAAGDGKKSDGGASESRADSGADASADISSLVDAPKADAAEAGADALDAPVEQAAVEGGTDAPPDEGTDTDTGQDAPIDQTEGGAPTDGPVEAPPCLRGPDGGASLCSLPIIGGAVTATLSADTPPTLTGGTLRDGTYQMREWVKYGTGAETAMHLIRISNCGTTFELLSAAGATTVRIGGAATHPAATLEITNGCGGGAPASLSFPYEMTGGTLKILTGQSTTKYLETYGPIIIDFPDPDAGAH